MQCVYLCISHRTLLQKYYHRNGREREEKKVKKTNTKNKIGMYVKPKLPGTVDKSHQRLLVLEVWSPLPNVRGKLGGEMKVECHHIEYTRYIYVYTVQNSVSLCNAMHSIS